MLTAPSGFRRFKACGCPSQSTPLNSVMRREVLTGGSAALALGVVTGFSRAVFAQPAQPHRIDVHHHISPPTWLDAVKRLKKDNPPMANWSLQKTLDDMDRGGVATAITSPTTPQLRGLEKTEASRLARESNEFAKKLETDYPGRFGTFAVLPLPHIEESLKEIAYAFDVLKVDGIGCLTSYDDKWLGYEDFTPVWEELNRRNATVYTHPTGANCCVNLVRDVDEAYIEYGTDTTRTIFSLIFSGISQKYKNINWIWSHGGGSLTAFADRFLVQAVNRPPYAGKITRTMVEGELNRFYYDTAQVANPVTLSAMAKLMPISQIVYGTDFPYRTAAENAKGIAEFFQPDELLAIERYNALRILPRLRTL